MFIWFVSRKYKTTTWVTIIIEIENYSTKHGKSYLYSTCFVYVCLSVARTNIHAFTSIYWTFMCMNGSQSNGYYSIPFINFLILLLSFCFSTLYFYVFVYVRARERTLHIDNSLAIDDQWSLVSVNSAYNRFRRRQCERNKNSQVFFLCSVLLHSRHFFSPVFRF